MKLFVFTMFGHVLQQNILVKRDFMAGGPVHVLTIEFAICEQSEDEALCIAMINTLWRRNSKSQH